MSIKLYNDLKTKYETTKPIRGRSTDVRPWGRRSRDWEQVIKCDRNGEIAYGAKLFNTDVVRVLPSGDVVLQSDGWYTPKTAEFIDGVLYGLGCFKQYNKLWVNVSGVVPNDERYFITPIPRTGDLLIKFDAEKNQYFLPNKPIVMQQVIDKDKAKAAREPIAGFKEYVKSMLKLTDSIVTNDTVKQYIANGDLSYWGVGFEFVHEGEILYISRQELRTLNKQTGSTAMQFMYDSMCRENLDVFPKLMYAFLEACPSSSLRNGSNGNTSGEMAQIYDIPSVMNKLNQFAVHATQAFKVVEVEVTKPITNVR
jgi:hypothetical protein